MRQPHVTKARLYVEEWEATQSRLHPVFRELLHNLLRLSGANSTGRPQGLV